MLTALSTQALPPPEIATELGERGRNLYWLAANGFPVPPTWVLGISAFDLILSRLGADWDVAEMRWNLTGLWNDLAAAERVVAALEEQRVSVARALRGAPLPDVLGRELERIACLDTLWSVHASPTLEDDTRAHFDGVFLSLLSVQGGADLWDAVRQVWASAFRREVLERCAQHEIPLPGMAVVLHPAQPIAEQDRSGVVFSASSRPGLAGPVVQAVFGAPQNGKGHVYGSACGRWIALGQHATPPEWAMVTDGSGGTALRPCPPHPPLTSAEVQHLVNVALNVAEKREAPVKVTFFWPAEGEPVLLHVQSA